MSDTPAQPLKLSDLMNAYCDFPAQPPKKLIMSAAVANQYRERLRDIGQLYSGDWRQFNDARIEIDPEEPKWRFE